MAVGEFRVEQEDDEDDEDEEEDEDDADDRLDDGPAVEWTDVATETGPLE